MKQHSCEYHGEESVGLCGWCAKHVCQRCVDDAHGHKLCPDCAEKLSKHKPLRRRQQREKGSGIKNKDASLTEKQIEEAKQRLERRAKEEDWPELKDT